MTKRYTVFIETDTRLITIYTSAISQKAVARKAMMKAGLNFFDINKMTIQKG